MMNKRNHDMIFKIDIKELNKNLKRIICRILNSIVALDKRITRPGRVKSGSPVPKLKLLYNHV